MKKELAQKALSFWTDKEMRLEAAHVLDLIETALTGHRQVVTPFLSRAMSTWLEHILKKMPCAYLSAGGFPESERVRFVIGSQAEEINSRDAEISLLRVEAKNPKARLEHRQILGSLMGLGLKREVIGDIQAGQNAMYVAVTAEIARFLLKEWEQSGSEKIRVKIILGEPDLLPLECEERKITVASSRLDAVVAGGFGVARSLMQEWIAQGRVKRNDLVISKPELEVHPGDIISCRGQGRLKLVENDGQTRKGRLAWRIQVFRAKRR